MAKLRIIFGLCIAVAITSVTWQLMRTYELNKQRDLLVSEAVNTRDLVLHDLRIRILAIDRMAARLASFDTLEERIFELEADSYLRDMPGFHAIGWIDNNGVLTMVEPPHVQRLLGMRIADIGPNRDTLLDLAARSSAFELSTPVKLNGGDDVGFLGAKAVRRGVNQIGTLWVVFRSEDWIKNLHFGMRQNHMNGVQLTVLLNGKTVFTSNGFEELRREAIESPALMQGGDEALVKIKHIEPLNSHGNSLIAVIVTSLVGILSIIAMIAASALRGSRIQGYRAARANAELTSTNAQMQLEVTHRRAAELEAKRSSEAKSQFLSTMSHELRTPMNGVWGMSELLSETDLTQEQRLYAEDLSQSSQNLVTVLSDILDFSKLERGSVAVSNEVLDIRALVSNAVHLFVPQAEKKGLEVSFHADANVPDCAVLDRAKLRQIVINLIRNAIKFTVKGTIAVRLSSSDDVQPRLKLSVTDTGVGIPEQKLNEIFTEFQQVDGDAARQFEGTGLGLSIIDRLTRAMSGEIHVTSEVGTGSEFSVFLPLQLPVDRDTTVKPVPELANTGEKLEAVRVLLAEDNLTNQRIVEAFLRGAGCALDIANDGHEAVDMFGQGSYDAVLMDVSMPNKNGYEATRDIRNIQSERPAVPCPIIGFTANCGDEDQRKCREAGMDDVLPKPATKGELRARLEHWLAHGTEFRPATRFVA